LEKQIAFAKAYGYVKYFYPSDESAELDWDRFAVYGAQEIDASSDYTETLKDLFTQWAPAVSFHGNQDQPAADQYYKTPVTASNAVYWQHIGNGEGRIGPFYQSARTNRPAIKLPESANDFGTVYRTLPVETMSKKEIKIKIKIRCSSDYQGAASLMLRQRAKTGEKREKSTSQLETTKSEWVDVELRDTIQTEQKSISLWLLSVGRFGSVQYDDLKVFFKDGSEWKPDSSLFENFDDTTWIETWKTFGPNQEISIKNKNGNGVLKISRSKGEEVDHMKLYQVDVSGNRKLKKKISEDLFINFPTILPSVSGATLPAPSDTSFIKLSQNLQSNDDSTFQVAHKYVRLANIIKTWNVFQHFYPYFDLIQVDWEDQLRKAIVENDKDRSLKDHVKTLKRMLAPLNDSHIGVYSTVAAYFPPIKWHARGDTIIITDVFDSSLTELEGARIIGVNGISASDFWEDRFEQANGATESRKQFKTQIESLQGDSGAVMELRALDAGEVKHYSLNHALTEEQYEELLTFSSYEPYDEISRGVFYVDLTRISWDFLETRLDELAGAEGLIFDLRGYPSWKTIEIVSHLTRDSLERIKTFSEHVLAPDRDAVRSVQREISFVTPREPFLKAPRVFITDARAISYAETFLNLIKYYDLAEIVGEQTAGSTGNTNTIFLYGGISIPFTGMKVLNQDGSQFHGIGIIPDHEIEVWNKTQAEAERDLIEKSLSLLTKQIG